jgi:plastocyanin
VNRRKKIRIRIVALTLGVVGIVVATSTASAQTPITITIRHQMHGCHAWSASPSGPYRPNLAIKLDRGSRLTFVNDDVMPHRLVQVSGKKATLTTANMNHMAARASVMFSRPGTYVFTTKAGEDYKWVHGMTTKGEDNVLHLKVTVS